MNEFLFIVCPNMAADRGAGETIRRNESLPQTLIPGYAPFPRRSCANIEETCCILNLDLVLLQENSCQIEGATWPASRLRKLSQPSFLSQPNPQLELTIQSINVICGLPAVQLP